MQVEARGGGKKTSETYPVDDVHQNRNDWALGDGGKKSERIINRDR